MATLHGWQPRLGSGLNRFQNLDTGQLMTLANVPQEVTLPGTPFSPEIMNELEQAIANAEILGFSAAPAASTPGALRQFGTYGGMIYYCTGAAISMTYGALNAGTYFFYAQNLPYSFTLSAAVSGLAFDGAVLKDTGGTVIDTNCWPQGTQITLTDASTYTWTPLQSDAGTAPISDELARALGLPTGSTVSDALSKLESCIYQQGDGSLCDVSGAPLQKIILKRSYGALSVEINMGQGEEPPALVFKGASGTSAAISPYIGNYEDISRLEIASDLRVVGELWPNQISYQCVSGSGYIFGPLAVGDTIAGYGVFSAILFGNLVKIDFGLSIRASGASSNYSYGLLASAISSQLGQTVTPIAKQFPATFYRQNTIFGDAWGYGGYMLGNTSGFWVPGRMYEQSGAMGEWQSSYFQSGDIITGTVYGTVSN